MEIRGFCSLTNSGTVTILGNLVIDRGITFDAVTNGNIDVLGSVEVRPGAVLGLGCNTVSVGNPPCTVDTNDRVTGSIVANKALAVIIHSTTVIGNVTITGGGGGSTPAARAPPWWSGPPCATAPFEDGSWSEATSDHRHGRPAGWASSGRRSRRQCINVSNNLTNTHDPGPRRRSPSSTIAGSLSCFANFPAATASATPGELTEPCRRRPVRPVRPPCRRRPCSRVQQSPHRPLANGGSEEGRPGRGARSPGWLSRRRTPSAGASETSPRVARRRQRTPRIGTSRFPLPAPSPRRLPALRPPPPRRGRRTAPLTRATCSACSAGSMGNTLGLGRLVL